MNKTSNATSIEWKEEYLISDHSLDEQHQNIFAIASKAKRLQEIQTQQEKEKEFKLILSELYGYINIHFKAEQEYMKQINYPYIKEHLSLHQTLLDKINFILVSLSTMSIEKAEEQLYLFIQKLFVEHITTEDIKIVNYNKDNK